MPRFDQSCGLKFKRGLDLHVLTLHTLLGPENVSTCENSISNNRDGISNFLAPIQ